MTATNIYFSTLQTRNGRTHFGMTREVLHMGFLGFETAGRTDPTGQKSYRLLLTKAGRVPWPKSPALMAKDIGLGQGMQPTFHTGPIIMAGHSGLEVRVPDDVHALNVGQDLPGLAVSDPAAGTPGGCGLARRRMFQWNAAGGCPGGCGLARRRMFQWNAAGGCPGGCGLARRRMFQWNKL